MLGSSQEIRSNYRTAVLQQSGNDNREAPFIKVNTLSEPENHNPTGRAGLLSQDIKSALEEKYRQLSLEKPSFSWDDKIDSSKVIKVGGRGNYSEHYRRFENITAQLEIPIPEVFVLEDEKSINYFGAFAQTSERPNGRIVFGKGTLDILTPKELDCVFLHELGHVLYGDSQKYINRAKIINRLDYLAMIVCGGVGSHSATKALRTQLQEEQEQHSIYATVSGLVACAYLLGRQYIQSHLAQKDEKRADEFTANLIEDNSKFYASALLKLGFIGSLHKEEAQNPLDIAKMFIKRIEDNFFPTHPSSKKRIEKLAEKQGKSFDSFMEKVTEQMLRELDK